MNPAAQNRTVAIITPRLMVTSIHPTATSYRVNVVPSRNVAGYRERRKHFGGNHSAGFALFHNWAFIAVHR